MLSRAHRYADADVHERSLARPALAPATMTLPLVLIGSLAIHGVAAMILVALPHAADLEGSIVAIEMDLPPLVAAAPARELAVAEPEPVVTPIPVREPPRVR